MATIIVGDDESAGDVAAKLLELAENQRQVRVRTDLGRPAFDVPDAVYKRYAGRGKRSEAERRVNAVDEMVAADDEQTAIVPSGDLPASAVNTDPHAGAAAELAELANPPAGDELPASAVNAEPPSNGDDQAEAEPVAAPRRARKRTPAKKAAAPAAAPGSGE